MAAQQDGTENTVDYIPRRPVMDHLSRLEAKHSEKVQQYKKYALDLKAKYREFELESHKHYALIIKKLQRTKDDIITNKESLIEEMTSAKDKAKDELNLLRAKLFKAKEAGVSTLLNYPFISDVSILCV